MMRKNLIEKIALLFTVLVLGFCSAQAQTQNPQGAGTGPDDGLPQNKGNVKGGSKSRLKAPEGTSVTGNKVKLKAGYKFVTEPDGYTVDVAKDGGAITGRFKCSCKTAAKKDTGGSCSFGTSGGDKAQCYAEDTCSECSLEIIVVAPGTVISNAGANDNSNPPSSPTPKPSPSPMKRH